MASIPKAHTQAITEIEALRQRLADLQARENELRKENQYLKEIYDRAPLGYQSLDESGCFIDVNQAWLDTLGYTREEVIGRNFGEFLHPDWREHFRENFPRFKAVGEILGVEFEIRKKDGRHIIVSFTGRIGTDQHGHFQQTYCVFQDITRQRQAEENYRHIVENAQEAIIVTRDEKLIMVNPAMSSIIGIPAEDLVSQSFAGFIHPQDREMVVSRHRERLQGEAVPAYYAFRVICNDGSIKWLHIHGALTSWDGEPAALSFLTDITEQKNAEEQLRNSEANLVSLFNAITESVCLIDRDGTVIAANETFANRVGKQPDDCAGKSIFSLIPEDIAAHRRLIVEEIIRTGKEAQFEDERWGRRFHHSLFPVLAPDGSVTRIAVFASDISERQMAENQLRRTGQLLDSIRKAQLLYIAHGDVQPVFDVLLDTLVSMTESEFGFLDEVLHDPDGTPYKLSLAFSNISWSTESQELYEQLRNHDLEFRNLTNLSGLPVILNEPVISNDAPHDPRSGGLPSGHPPINSFMGLPVRSSGRVVGVAGVANRPGGYDDEIALFLEPYLNTCAAIIEAVRLRTRERDMITALEESEGKYRLLVETANEGIWSMDAEHRTTYVNQAMADMLGYPIDDILGKAVEEFFFPEDSDFHEQRMTVRHQGIDETYEQRFRRADGSPLWTLVSAKVLTDDQGRFTGSFALYTDITERKQAELESARLQDQLTQAQKIESIGRLAGGVAHDFNNMLGVILGYTELILEQVDEDQSIHAALQQIQRAALHSADLTSKLLAFARKQTVKPKILDLNETVSGMLTMLRRLIGEDIELTWRPGQNLPQIKMDPSQIDQILANLCINARDAIGDTGKIVIETMHVPANGNKPECSEESSADAFVMLTVSDTGCGMDAETISHLFEPFFTTKSIGAGTGLGLATVYGIVKQNNGLIEVSSEPGQGTTFTIYLPCQERQSAGSSLPDGTSLDTRDNETILLVEDEPMILEMTTMMLKKIGYHVLAASTPAEAIRIAQKQSGGIDLLMTDVIMPEMNGRDLAQTLSSLSPHLLCLFMSGYTADVIAHHGILDANVHFIEKPFSKKELSAKLKEILKKKGTDRF